MSFRYSYTATMKGDPTEDINGNPIEGTPVTFQCDYQPNVSGTKIKYSGSFVDVGYKLFVSPSSETTFTIGSEVTCNAVTGVIVAIFPTRLNTEIWVK